MATTKIRDEQAQQSVDLASEVTGILPIANGGTGASSIPTWNQNTTGSAATLTTSRTINGVSFNGSANITVPNSRAATVINAPGATPTIDVGTYSRIMFTGLNAAITSMSSGLTGSADAIVIGLKDNATARAITWGASWVAIGITLPTTTVVSKWTYVGAFWNSTDSVWHATAVVTQA